MKYAVVESGGKQYVAREGETIEVDRLPLEIGKPIEFKDVLLVVDDGAIQVGDPLVKGASVKGEVLDQIKAKKVIVFKYIPKERYRRKQGHRQRYTRVRIGEILSGGAKKAAEAKADKPAAAESKPAKKAEAVESAPAKKAETKPKAAAKPKTPASDKPKSAAKPASKAKSSGTSKSSSNKSPSAASKKSSTPKASKKKAE